MDLDQPLQSGVTQVQSTEPDGVENHVRASTMIELARDFVFFTPALIVTYGQFDRRDVLREHPSMLALADDLQPKCIDSRRPFFAGIPFARGINWNHRLYMMPSESFPTCLAALGQMTICRMSEPKHYAKVGHYILRMVDPNALAIGQANPVIDVVVFVVSTTNGVVYLEPAADPPLSRPYVTFGPVDPAVVQEARAFFHGGPDAVQV